MSTENADREPISEGDQRSEEELRAAYEAEIKRIRVEHVLLEQVVSMVNLGMRRTGLGPGTESERDPGQVRLAIEAIRALMPLIEASAPEQARPIRDALSQLQIAFVRIGGAPAAGGVSKPPPPGATPEPSAAGPGRPGGSPPAGPGGPGGSPPAGPGGPGGSPPAGPGGPGAPPPAGPGRAPAAGEPAGGRAGSGEGGPAQRSGRLWVPRQ